MRSVLATHQFLRFPFLLSLFFSFFSAFFSRVINSVVVVVEWHKAFVFFSLFFVFLCDFMTFFRPNYLDPLLLLHRSVTINNYGFFNGRHGVVT